MAVPVIQTHGHVAGAAADPVVVPAPSGITDGDILLAWIGVETDSVSITPPAGFTSIIRVTRATVAAAELFWKRASGESGSYTFTETGNSWGYGSITRISGAVASGSPLDVVGTSTNGTTTTTVIPGVTTLTADVLVLAFSGDLAGHTGIATGPIVEVYDTPAASNPLYLASMAQASPGATGDQTITWLSAPNHTVGVLIGIASTASGGTSISPTQGAAALGGTVSVIGRAIQMPSEP